MDSADVTRFGAALGLGMLALGGCDGEQRPKDAKDPRDPRQRTTMVPGCQPKGELLRESERYLKFSPVVAIRLYDTGPIKFLVELRSGKKAWFLPQQRGTRAMEHELAAQRVISCVGAGPTLATVPRTISSSWLTRAWVYGGRMDSAEVALQEALRTIRWQRGGATVRGVMIQFPHGRVETTAAPPGPDHTHNRAELTLLDFALGHWTRHTDSSQWLRGREGYLLWNYANAFEVPKERGTRDELAQRLRGLGPLSKSTVRRLTRTPPNAWIRASGSLLTPQERHELMDRIRTVQSFAHAQHLASMSKRPGPMAVAGNPPVAPKP